MQKYYYNVLLSKSKNSEKVEEKKLNATNVLKSIHTLHILTPNTILQP